MSARIVFNLPGCQAASPALLQALGARGGDLETRHFPDGELYLRVLSQVRDCEALIYGSLDQPDGKLIPLIFLAQTLRALGARRVGLVAPYLAYMRQDRQFQPGEGITSHYFAALLSQHLDWLVTVDPHLHRIHQLGDIYRIPTCVVHAAGAIAAWIRDEVPNPVLVGPDAESAQWVGEVAAHIGAPHTVLQKTRRGDREVEVSMPHLDAHRDRTPVLVDDIISTARTMIQTVRHLRTLGLPAPVCVGVHGLFAGTAYQDLQAAGAARVVTTGSVPHSSNAISLDPLLAGAVEELLPK